MKKITLSSNQIVFLLTLYFVVVLNIGLWQTLWTDVPFSQSSNRVLWLTLPFFIMAFIGFFLQLLFLPYVHRLLVPFLLVSGSGAAYAVWVQKIYFNSDMIENILQTNQGEAVSWLTLPFVLWVLFTGIMPAAAYLWLVRIKPTTTWLQAAMSKGLGLVMPLAVIGVIGTFAYVDYASLFRNHRGLAHQTVPTNLLGAISKTVYNAYQSEQPLIRIGLDATRKPKAHTVNHMPHKQILVVVVGETTRAQNWGLNPDSPNTTPQLAKIPEVINFQHVSSCGTATAISLPCLFSNMPRVDYDANLASHQEGVLDILQRAGLPVLWYDNDGGCKGVCDRIKHFNLKDFVSSEQCNGEGCYDTAFLPVLQQAIDDIKGDGVIVLHTIGSHGPAYFERYTNQNRHFSPTCNTNQIQMCTPAELQNTYNNTVVAIDDMLAQSITLLKHQPQQDEFALWYFSDHGESLGENGMYLHGAPYFLAPKAQTQIPMIFWANPTFYRSTRLSPTCLENIAKNQTFSHDNIFHSLLGIMRIDTSEYQSKLDLFQPCQASDYEAI